MPVLGFLLVPFHRFLSGEELCDTVVPSSGARAALSERGSELDAAAGRAPAVRTHQGKAVGV